MDNPANQDAGATQVTPPTPPTEPAPAAKPSSAHKFGASGPGHNFKHTVPVQDLLNDKLILSAPRVELGGRQCPALGGIALTAKLGQGGMGAVYLGVHLRLSQEVALKVLPFHLAETQPDLIQRFIREAQIAARVHSPHLVSVRDVNEESGLYFLIMEFVHGRSAGHYLRELRENGRNGAAEAEALDICIAAARGLAAAHAAGVIHRDIKPDNVIVPFAKDSNRLDFPAAKLADLGLARSEEMAQSMTGANACMGTPGYMSPEQVADARNCTTASDVFSLGATLYAMLSCQAPFTGSGMMQIMLATSQQPHAPIRNARPDVSAGTAALLDRCLAKNPAERHTDAAAVLAALQACRNALGPAPGIQSGPGSSGAMAPTLLRPRSPQQEPSTHISGEAAKAAVVSPQTSAPLATVSTPAAPLNTPAAAKKSGAALGVAAAIAILLGGAALGVWQWKSSEKTASVDSKPVETAKPPVDTVATVATVTEKPPATHSGDDARMSPPPPEPALQPIPKIGELDPLDLKTAPAKPPPPPILPQVVEPAPPKDAGVHPDRPRADTLLVEAREKLHKLNELDAKLRGYDHSMSSGRNAMKIARWQEAINDFSEALKDKPDDSDARKALGAAYAALGQAYEEGKDWPKDFVESATQFKKGADLGDSDAQCGLGRRYMSGQGVARDYNQALDLYRKAIAQGNHRAENDMGLMYAYGYGVQRDDAEACNWWKTAAEYGEPHAEFLLGRAYAEGRGVPRNEAEAMKWMRKGADRGTALCQNGMGVLYEHGDGVKADPAEAVKWYRAAADQGLPIALTNLSHMYEFGLGVNKDPREALRLLNKAVEQGDATAEYRLGFCYANGLLVQRDDSEAFKWARMAAEQDVILAETLLADLYSNGRGTAMNAAEALKWYRKAADSGESGAEDALGLIYLNGLGVVKDFNEAFKWFKSSAGHGNAIGEYNLGLAYLNGVGTPVNFNEGLRLIRLSASHGWQPAEQELARRGLRK